MLRRLLRSAPTFGLDGSAVKVLSTPSDFHNALLNNIEKARSRISLASLYFGTGSTEQALARRLSDACSAHDDLRVRVLLDHSRGTRVTGGACSASVLASHLGVAGVFEDAAGLPRFSVSLLQMPQLRGSWKRHLPKPLDETVAVMHLKIYAFDDVLLLSGANLSADYFEHRQDRYIELRNAGGLADHYHDLVDHLSRCDHASGVYHSTPQSSTEERGYELVPRPAPDAPALEDVLDGFLKNRCNGVHRSSGADTIVIPTLQLGAIGKKSLAFDFDSRVTSELLRLCAASPSGAGAMPIRLATGYFNLIPATQELLASSLADVRVLTASPRANGFWGAASIRGAVPAAYAELERCFIQRCAHVRSTGERKGDATIADSNGAGFGAVRVFEYARKAWTFHAKGLWLWLHADELEWLWDKHQPQHAAESLGANPELPNATLVGSPNFGARSAWRDLESQCVIATTNPDLRRQLNHEWNQLSFGEGSDKCGAVVVDDALLEHNDRKLRGWGWQHGKWIRFATRVIASYL